MQLGLAALRKAQRHSSSFQRYIEDLLDFVPDLREDICACALEEYSVQMPVSKPLWMAVKDSCEDV